jgi:hypothetical protein
MRAARVTEPGSIAIRVLNARLSSPLYVRVTFRSRKSESRVAANSN